MGLPRNRPERHRTGGEPLDNFADRFDVVQRQRRPGALEPEQAAQVARRPILGVDFAGKGLETLIITGPDRVLQGADGFRRPHVIFAAQPESVFAADIQRVA